MEKGGYASHDGKVRMGIGRNVTEEAEVANLKMPLDRGVRGRANSTGGK